MSDQWPFSDPRNVIVITTKRIIQGEASILQVSRNREDGFWQFLDGKPVNTDDAAVVALGEMAQLDPSILELADLLPGWEAWRSNNSAPWQRAQALQE